jgi:plastocyanin
MKKIWISVIVVAVLLIAGSLYYFFQNTPYITAYTPPPHEPAGHGVVGNVKLDKDSFDVTITYTDSGFDPAAITIKQGQRVRFLNNSHETFWPASGVHPTHSLYPEKESTDCLGSSFDACQDLKPGEYFDFTFYYLGTWPFHDHLHPVNTGSITVQQ